MPKCRQHHRLDHDDTARITRIAEADDELSLIRDSCEGPANLRGRLETFELSFNGLRRAPRRLRAFFQSEMRGSA
jgi:hypothetical protein